MRSPEAIVHATCQWNYTANLNLAAILVCGLLVTPVIFAWRRERELK